MPNKHWPVIIVIVAGVLCTLPGLDHDYWHDEVYTLTHFATGWREALFDYHAPNNHRLFSLLLWGWLHIVSFEHFLEVGRLRVLPLAFFLISAAVLAAVAGRARFGGGKAAALMTGLLFVGWHPVICFASELRGYSLSWLCAIGAAAGILAWARRRRARDLWGYLVACWLGVLTLPTFLMVPAALGTWLAWERLASEGTRGLWRHWRELLAVGLGPSLGLLTYLPCLSQMEEAVAQGAAMGRGELSWHYPWALAKDWLWLAPLLAVAAAGALGWLDCAHRGKGGEAGRPPRPLPPMRRERQAWRFAICAFTVPFALALALPRPPNDRVLATALPLVALGLGALVAGALRRLPRWGCPNDTRAATRRPGLWWAAALGATALGIGALHESPLMADALAIAVPDEDWRPEMSDLYDQWYHRGHQIMATTLAVTEDCRERPGVAVFDRSDPLSLMFYFALLRGTAPLDAVWFDKLRHDPGKLAHWQAAARGKPLYLITPTRAEANAMATAIGRPLPRHAHDYGYCQVFISAGR